MDELFASIRHLIGAPVEVADEEATVVEAMAEEVVVVDMVAVEVRRRLFCRLDAILICLFQEAAMAVAAAEEDTAAALATGALRRADTHHKDDRNTTNRVTADKTRDRAVAKEVANGNVTQIACLHMESL